MCARVWTAQRETEDGENKKKKVETNRKTKKNTNAYYYCYVGNRFYAGKSKRAVIRHKPMCVKRVDTRSRRKINYHELARAAITMGSRARWRPFFFLWFFTSENLFFFLSAFVFTH